MVQESTKGVLRRAFQWAVVERIKISARARGEAASLIHVIADFAQHVSGFFASALSQHNWATAVKFRPALSRPCQTEFTRRNDTRWNLTHEFLTTFVDFEQAVEHYLSSTGINGLTTDKYSLSRTQWADAAALVAVGEPFKQLAVSVQAGDPQGWKTIRNFEKMEADLFAITIYHKAGSLLRVGAKAALFVSGEYYVKVGDDALPAFGSVFFHPGHHLEFFLRKGTAWVEEDCEGKLEELHEMYLQVYVPAYGSIYPGSSAPQAFAPDEKIYAQNSRSFATAGLDPFRVYAKQARIFHDDLAQYGHNPVMYWKAQQGIPSQAAPAEMAIDFLTIPPTACDAE